MQLKVSTANSKNTLLSTSNNLEINKFFKKRSSYGKKGIDL